MTATTMTTCFNSSITIYSLVLNELQYIHLLPVVFISNAYVQQEQQRVAVGPGNVHLIFVRQVSSDAGMPRAAAAAAAKYALLLRKGGGRESVRERRERRECKGGSPQGLVDTPCSKS